MAISKLHPLAKTSIQVRHTISRLETFIETSKDEDEKVVAGKLLQVFSQIQTFIPKEYRNVDMK